MVARASGIAAVSVERQLAYWRSQHREPRGHTLRASGKRCGALADAASLGRLGGLSAAIAGARKNHEGVADVATGGRRHG
jgi:hypothetical protein